MNGAVLLVTSSARCTVRALLGGAIRKLRRLTRSQSRLGEMMRSDGARCRSRDRLVVVVDLFAYELFRDLGGVRNGDDGGVVLYLSVYGLLETNDRKKYRIMFCSGRGEVAHGEGVDECSRMDHSSRYMISLYASSRVAPNCHHLSLRLGTHLYGYP